MRKKTFIRIADFSPFWIISIRAPPQNNEEQQEQLAYIEFTTAKQTRSTSSANIKIHAHIPKITYQAHIDNFFVFQERNPLSNSLRKQTVDTMLKKNYNYQHHLSWNQVNINKILGNIPTFTATRK